MRPETIQETEYFSSNNSNILGKYPRAYFSQNICKITFVNLLNFLSIFGLDCLNGKESPCSTGDLDSVPGSGRSPGEESDNLLEYSCLENPMDKEA